MSGKDDNRGSSQEHRAAAAGRGPVRLALVTVSDTRTEATDANGQWLRGEVERLGHAVAMQRIVPDEPEAVRAELDEAVAAGARVVVFNGGTGITARDTTIDVVEGMLEKVMPGFGEIFRVLSYEQVGAAAMLSRAVAGTYRGTVVFCTPGSPKAVRLAWEKLIAPELEHVAWELGR